MTRKSLWRLRVGATVGLLGLAALVLQLAARADEPARFVGGQVCVGCHQAESQLWQASHHAKAMQEASGPAVLGDFAGAELEHFGVTTTFFRAGDKQMVRTEGPDGALHDYPVAYTFGVYPLQQYLIAMPGGRYQALGIAWDARAREQGGQRWFPLYPGQKLVPRDPLHWTGRDQTWNYMCAGCHSTNLSKNYDLSTDSYSTTWTDVAVSCEACHGPGSRHVAWARSPGRAADQGGMGLSTRLKAADRGVWKMNEETGIAQRSEPLRSAELDTCAPCHARRKVIAPAPAVGGPFLDGYLPRHIEPGLYHADGQIEGEVFEYGSFMQSRMHREGVTCSNCHEPHSLSLRADGNSLCAQCHAPAKFDKAQHHHHQPGGAGAQCVSCHMAAKTFMGVDRRRDHGFRIPRPDLTASIGVPNACSQCHADRPAQWAAGKIAEWFPNGRQTTSHYGIALHAGIAESANAEGLLDQLVLDAKEPAIVRGSALLELRPYASPASETALIAASHDPDPLVRAAVPRALPDSPLAASVPEIASLLADPVRAVRIEAARALAGSDLEAMSPSQRASFDTAFQELVAAEAIDADRPEAHVNLGLLDVERGLPEAAEAEYRTALRLEPKFVPALLNLADLDRMRGRDEEGGALLRQALAIEPNNADIHHALGLLLVREHDDDEGLRQLRQASELAPGSARYAYVYAIALNSTGAADRALALLERTHREHPADRDVLLALVSMEQERGDLHQALLHARELAALSPGDEQIGGLIEQLELRGAR